MEKVLIIGGCGYIGTRLNYFLTSKGFNTASVDLEWFGRYGSFENSEQDFKFLPKEYLAQFPVVILLAGHSSVKMCEDNMKSCFSNNVSNFIGLISKLDKHQKFIYASSSSIYGGLENKMMSESSNQYQAFHFYDLSKYEIDSYSKLSKDVEYYGLRFGTVNGFSYNFRSDIMLNSMFTSASASGDIFYSNPNILRPILAMSDLCDAVYSIIRNGEFSKRGIYNLASFNSTVKEIATEASNIMGSRLVKKEDSVNPYDFSINTDLFTSTFNFKFTGSVASILNELLRGREQINPTNRNKAIKYE